MFDREYRKARQRAAADNAWYDVSPDGQRFLMLKPDETSGAASIVMVQNWLEELKQRVPAK